MGSVFLQALLHGPRALRHRISMSGRPLSEAQNEHFLKALENCMPMRLPFSTSQLLCPWNKLALVNILTLALQRVSVILRIACDECRIWAACKVPPTTFVSQKATHQIQDLDSLANLNMDALRRIAFSKHVSVPTGEAAMEGNTGEMSPHVRSALSETPPWGIWLLRTSPLTLSK